MDHPGIKQRQAETYERLARAAINGRVPGTGRICLAKTAELRLERLYGVDSQSFVGAQHTNNSEPEGGQA